jgi:hypothetical protein
LGGDLAPDVLQYPYDLVAGAAGPVEPGKYRITFGFLSGALSAVVDLLSADPSLRRRCSELADRDLASRVEVAALLARDAIRHNPDGMVLVSTTSVPHLRDLVRQLDRPGPREAEALVELAARLSPTGGDA